MSAEVVLYTAGSSANIKTTHTLYHTYTTLQKRTPPHPDQPYTIGTL